ncbi:hypothetical protein KJ969_05765, partial [Patescibacteria group bacterium]|nr:hypothetical protein [Patescibacteria group bacterium]MBU1922608.1 hypothetical protein [Patescibacteria group bacterium]
NLYSLGNLYTSSSKLFVGADTYLSDFAGREDSGAYFVGVDPTNIGQSTSTNVQFVLEDISSVLGTVSTSANLWSLGASYIYPTSTTADVYVSGNVGIGTSTPAAKLDVNGNAIVRGGALNLIRDTSSVITLVNAAEDAYTSLWTRASDYQFQIGSTPKVVIDASGYVGIGITSPANKLSVAGSIDVGAVTDQGLILYESAGEFAGIHNIVEGGGDVGITFKTTTNAQAGLTEQVRINHLGYVGIGTTLPSDLLTVMGGNIVVGDGSTSSTISGSATSTFPFGATFASTGGNVGIGTTAPGSKLEIRDGNLSLAMVSSRDPRFFLTETGQEGVEGLDLWYDNNVGSIYFDSTYDGVGGDIYFRTKTAGTPVDGLFIESTGDVGIGTTNPGYKLQVRPTANVNFDFTNNGAEALLMAANDAASVIDLTTNAWEYHFQSNGSEKMTILSSGNVGIGASTPAAKLNLLLPGTTYDSGILLGYSNHGLSLWYDENGATSAYIESRYDNETAAMNFRMRANGTPVNAVTILGSGNVGIGTIAPQYTLDVIGTGSFSGDLFVSHTDLIIGDGTGGTSLGEFSDRLDSGAYFVGVDPTNIGQSTSTNVQFVLEDISSVLGTVSSSANLWSLGASYIYPTSTTADVYLAQTQNLGVGTNNASTTVHVYGSYPFVLINDYSSQSFLGLRGDARVFFDNGSDYQIASQPYANRGTGNGETVRFLIEGDTGNIGIGTGTPGARLDVRGAIKLGDAGSYFIGDATHGFRFNNNADTENNVHFYDNAGVAIGTGAGYANHATGPGANNVVIEGSVGIGTTSPTSTLQVSGGDVHFQGNAGVPGMYWDESAGKLGVGTTAPVYALDIQAAVGSANLQSTVATNYALFRIYNTNAKLNLGTEGSGAGTMGAGTLAYSSYVGAANGVLHFGDTDTVRMTLSSGLVGIGDTSPDFGLEIATSSTDGYLAVSSLADNNGDLFVVDGTGKVGIGDSTPNQTLHVVGSAYITDDSNDQLFEINANDGTASLRATYLVAGPYPPITFWTSGSEQVRIDTSGNMGIHDTDPDFGLELATSSTAGYFGVSTSAGADGDLFVVAGDGDVGIGTAAPGARLEVENNGDAWTTAVYIDQNKESWIINAESAYNYGVKIQTGSNTGTTSALEIWGWDRPVIIAQNGGLVGMGTNTPQYNLDVIGTGSFSGDLFVSHTDLIIGDGTGGTSLGESTAADDSGAYFVGVFDEFDYSA